jgi:hypothetical protein
MNISEAVSANNSSLLSASNYANMSNNAIIMKIAKRTGDPVDDTVMDFNYQEIWDKVGCPSLKSMTEGDILSVRGASYQWVDTTYDFVPVPINFLDTEGAEYCFESYEGISTDFGLAQTYERDYWYGQETNSHSSRSGSGNGGGVDSASFTANSNNSNYCNRGNNRMPTVTSCSGARYLNNWLNTGTSKWFSKWYMDAPTVRNPNAPSTQDTAQIKWFFCGGNGAHNSLHVSGGGDLEDYQIRLRPGYRGTDMSDYRRINNRTFKAYARVPGSRALHKQAFSMSVRGTTFFWEYDYIVPTTNP